MAKMIDRTGRKYGKLTVLFRDTKTDKKGIFWICRCECGNIVSVNGDNLQSGNTTSCGCTRKETIAKSVDLTGQKFGLLTVTRRSHTDKNGHAYFKCRCSCDNECTVSSANLKSGKIVSCGCYKNSELLSGRIKTAKETTETGTNIGKIKSKAPLKSNKTTGIRGVCYIKSQGMYKAYITFQRKKYVLKMSKDIEKCIKARKEAEKEIYGNFLEWYEKSKNSGKP